LITISLQNAQPELNFLLFLLVVIVLVIVTLIRAMLRGDHIGGTELRLRTTRYQDAVPFYIENGFADFGATAANAVVKQWTDKGGKVVLRSRAVPIKQFIASNRLSQDEREKIRETLLNLAQTEPGRRALAASGYKGFVAPDAEVEKTTIAWLGL